MRFAQKFHSIRASEPHRPRKEEIVNRKGWRTLRLMSLIMPALVLTTTAFAQVRPTTLSDSQEPGSVIVFPKFVQGTVVLPEGGTAPISVLKIGVVCPKGVVCPEHQPVKIRLHWVCGTSEADLAGSFICRANSFDVTATVFEKIVLVSDGSPDNFYGSGLPTKFIPAAPCTRGYLIGWVTSPNDDQPIKFDGLIGNAVLRPGSQLLASPTAQATYNAIPIQADPKLANGAVITTNANGALFFDGGAGHYQAVTGQILGDVTYTNLTTGPTFTKGMLTLLTLDVKSNRPNNPVFVDLDFFGGNPSAIGNENQLSTTTEFICWEEVAIDQIDPNLTTTLMGREGVVVSFQAKKVGIFGITDETGPTTLLGLSEALEGGTFPSAPISPGPWPRASFSGLFNSSVPAPTRFLQVP
jgi:hypothetical protein